MMVIEPPLRKLKKRSAITTRTQSVVSTHTRVVLTHMRDNASVITTSTSVIYTRRV
jgi:hypothetical protein